MRGIKKTGWIVSVIIVFQCLMPAEYTIACQKKDGYNIIKAVVGYVNRGDIAGYISLFTNENQFYMKEYVDDNGEYDFFQEDHITLLGAKKLSYNTGLSSAGVTDSELDRYKDIQVFYTHEDVVAKSTATRVSDGTVKKVYVLGIEEGDLKIIRISSPNSMIIFAAGENFQYESRGTNKSRFAFTLYDHYLF